MKRALALVIALVTTITLAGCFHHDHNNDNTFKLGLLPTEAATEMRASADNLETYLSAAMNREVEVQIPSSYEALFEALRFGHIDAAFFDGGPAAMAHAQFGAEVVLAEVKNGETYYNASLFVRTDDESIQTLADIPGKKIAFTSWTGSSGFLYPMGSLIKEGYITPADDSLAGLQAALDESFEQHTFSGGYTQSLSLLLNGEADVVGGSHLAPEKYLDAEDQQKVRKLLELGRVPSHPVVVSPDMSTETKNIFVTAILGLNTEENNAILTELYGVDELRATTTAEHLAGFDEIISALPALQEKVMSKKH